MYRLDNSQWSSSHCGTVQKGPVANSMPSVGWKPKSYWIGDEGQAASRDQWKVYKPPQVRVLPFWKGSSIQQTTRGPVSPQATIVVQQGRFLGPLSVLLRETVSKYWDGTLSHYLGEGRPYCWQAKLSWSVVEGHLYWVTHRRDFGPVVEMFGW